MEKVKFRDLINGNQLDDSLFEVTERVKQKLNEIITEVDNQRIEIDFIKHFLFAKQPDVVFGDKDNQNDDK